MKKNELQTEREKIRKGLELAHQRMVEFKRQKKSPIIVYEDGQIKEIDPSSAVFHNRDGA